MIPKTKWVESHPDVRLIRPIEVGNKSLALEIDSFTDEEFTDFSGVDKKVVVCNFTNGRAMRLNDSNVSQLCSIFGDAREDALGGQITLMAGERVDNGRTIRWITIEEAE